MPVFCYKTILGQVIFSIFEKISSSAFYWSKTLHVSFTFFSDDNLYNMVLKVTNFDKNGYAVGVWFELQILF